MTSLDVVALFEAHGGQSDGESVTQLEHALQCAALARRHRANDEVVMAALLHDIGHLTVARPDDETRHHGQRLALEIRPWFVDAIRIRRWDEEAKVPGTVVPALDEYRPLLERWLGPQSRCGAGVGRA